MKRVLILVLCLIAFGCSGGENGVDEFGETQQALGPVGVSYTYDSSNNFVVTVTDATATSARLYCGATDMGLDSSAPFVWTVPASTCNGTSLNGYVYNGGSSQVFSPLVTLQSPLMAAGSLTNCFGFTGKAYCMGRGQYGALGNGSTTDSNVPVQVGTSRTVVEVHMHIAGGCYRELLSNQQISCWGRNQYGITGQDPAVTTQSTTPVNIANSNQGVTGLAVGDYHACLLRNGDVYCWGKGGNGQLGNGGTSDSHTLVGPVLSGVESIAAGGDTTCAIKASGSLWCWGRDDWGQVGNGGSAALAITTPVQIGLGFNGGGVAVGYRHTCAYKTNGDTWCAGENTAGQLMQGTADSSTHVSLLFGSYSGTTITGIFSGHDRNTCLLQNGSIKCVGENTTGVLGNNTTSAYETALKVPNGFTSAIASYSIGRDAALGFRAGHAYAWGDNSSGQLGDPALGATQLTPNQIPGF